MSKTAANMMSVLLSQEFKDKKIAVGILHPGFNKTGMTAKYEHIWEVGDLVIWDNRCTLHRRDAFDNGTRRVMWRTQIKNTHVA